MAGKMMTKPTPEQEQAYLDKKRARFTHLLNDGEAIEKLDLGGWIVLRNKLAIDDSIIIDGGDGAVITHLFDRPVRARVKGISSNNLLAVELLTDAKGYHDGDSDTYWDKHPSGWLDCMWDTYRITPPDNGIAESANE